MKNDLNQFFTALDERPGVAAYIQAARQVPLFKDRLAPLRVALLASFTIDAAVPFLTVEAARLGFAGEIHVAPFNSVKQELLGADSGTVRHKPDVVFVANVLADVSPALANNALAHEPAQIDQQIGQLVDDLVASLKEFRKRSSAAMVVHNFARPQAPALGIYEPMAAGSPTDVVNRINARLVEAVRAISGVYVLDFDRVCADVGYSHCFDDKMWYLGRSPFSAAAWRALAQTQAAFVRALFGPQRKCLVLDLDNVLWGDIIGESGVANIKLGQTYPGNVFRDFQQAVLALHQRGVLLAINSKNNPTDVDEVFRSHPDMVLKKEHFACIRVNWQDKSTNMKEIAATLNIGLESLVFFDDSPAEQALMRETLPQVLTLPVPPEPIKYARLLRDSRAFDRLSLTDEDRRRGKMYQEQAARRQVEQAAGSVEDFLAGLQMTAAVESVDDFAFPRVVDLLQKTNQFNLTTRRYTAGQLRILLDDPQCGVFSLRVADRFGDNGIVGVAIVRQKDESAVIDSFLLSCRVIGRTVETALLSFLAEWARDRGLNMMEGEFLPTTKNAPAADFFARHGFSQVGDAVLETRWRLDLTKVPVQWPACIQRQGRAVAAK